MFTLQVESLNFILDYIANNENEKKKNKTKCCFN